MDSREEKNIGGDGHVAIHDWEPVDSFGHHKLSSEIEKDIDETRHTMDVLFDSLTEKLHPRAIIDDLVDRAQLPENRRKIQDGFLSVGRRIADSFQDNPVPFLLIGVGVAWTLLDRYTTPVVKNRVDRNRFQERAGEFMENASQNLKGRFEDAKEALKNRREKAGESFTAEKENAAGPFKETVEKGRQAAENARERFEQTRGQGYSWQQRFTEQYGSTGNSVVNLIREKPLAVGFAAAMLGMAAGILFPETKAEQRTVGEPAKQASDWAKEKSADIAERGKEVVHETADTAFQKTKEKGLTPEESAKRVNETGTNVTNPIIEKDKKEAVKASKDVVSPGIENVEVNLKEKSDAKNLRKESPDKPQNPGK